MVPLNLIFAGLLAVSVVGAGLFGYHQGAKSVQAELDAFRAATASFQALQREQALTRERELQAHANRLRKELTREKTRLAAVQRELADSLSDRADRPSDGGVPQTAGDRDAAPGCTGAEIFRSDSQFLLREATRADTLRLHLAACQAAYNEAVKGQK